MGPASKGQLSLEIEAIDAGTGRQVALLLLADEADMRDIRKSYTPDGHAKALAGRFAIEAVEFIAPMVRSRQLPGERNCRALHPGSQASSEPRLQEREGLGSSNCK